MTRMLHTRRTPLMLLLPFTLLLLSAPHTASAQTTTFTYQGRLLDAGALAAGPHDLEFKLYDAAGTQLGATVTHEDVPLIDGSFVVLLDFGDSFDGTERFLEIGVRPGESVDEFTTLNPRWPITSTPYAIRSIKATAADTATNATTADTATNATTADTATTATDATQLGGVAADQYVKTDDPRLEGGGPPAPGSPDYVQNTTAPQADSNFNVSGNGTLGGTLSANNVGVGTATPDHRLSIVGGPQWTTNNWRGAMSLENGAAIAWQSNTANNRYGIGHSNGGMFFFRTTSNPGTAVSSATADMTISDSGNVGVGTVDPQAKLEVNPGGIGSMLFGTPSSETGISIRTNATKNRADIRFDGNTLKLVTGVDGFVPPSANGVVISTAGNVGVGTFNPLARLHVAGGGIRYENGGKVLNIGTGSEVDVASPTSSVVISGRNPNGSNHVILNPFPINNPDPNFRSGNVGIGTFGPQTKLHVVGTTRTSILEIVGGGDFAENFDVRGVKTSGVDASSSAIKPGMVVAIDALNPGKLVVSGRAYNRRVAGIISGAGGIKAGMVMGQEGSIANGKHPVALTGRVYVWADAARGAIKPGDLLTTSATPGHAMRVANHAKAQGAIIGKAMTGLKRGRALVLVLVTLQ